MLTYDTSQCMILNNQYTFRLPECEVLVISPKRHGLYVSRDQVS